MDSLIVGFKLDSLKVAFTPMEVCGRRAMNFPSEDLPTYERDVEVLGDILQSKP